MTQTQTQIQTEIQAQTQSQSRRRRSGPVRIGALYDLVVALPFATPWSAAAIVDVLRSTHGALGLAGEGPPGFAAAHVLFVNFFGVVVGMWAVVRLLRDDAVLAVADTFGRGGFALLMGYALAAGVTPVLGVFLVVEVGFLGAQAWELRQRRSVRLHAQKVGGEV